MHPEKGSGWQAGVQMSGIVVTLLFAIVGGTITGLIQGVPRNKTVPRRFKVVF